MCEIGMCDKIYTCLHGKWKHLSLLCISELLENVTRGIVCHRQIVIAI